MTNQRRDGFGCNILCVVPPYGTRVPAGMAYLLGYLEAYGCNDFDFVDLRLGAPFDFTPTYRTTGAFGESYVIDVPDLPLVLGLLKAHGAGATHVPWPNATFERFCLERGISSSYLQRYLECMERYLDHALSQLPKVRFIGFSVWSTNYLFTLIAASMLKRRRNAPVVVMGGPQVTSSRAAADLALRSGLADVVVLGDGEETFLELYRAFDSSGLVSHGLPGTATFDRMSGVVQRVERERPRMKDVVTPSFAQMPVQSYQERPDVTALPLQFSRGCTDKCSFCSEWVFWKRFRPDAPEHTVEHIIELKRRYGCNFIDFSDSLLNGISRRLVALAEQMLASSLDIGWTAFMRAEMDPKTAELIARAGCTGVFIGVESFSDEALTLMNKRRTEADNVRAIRSFLEAGIYVTAGFIPGFPGDSRAGFLHSVAVVRELQARYPGMLELHEEPFTVMASAPIHGALAGSGLTPLAWDGCYLDVAPEYRDVTEGVICRVDGEGQGLERIGRMRIIGAAKSDAPVQGKFVDGCDDDLTFQRFCFDHLTGNWYWARIKDIHGHRYSLIVDEVEVEALEEMQAEHFPLEDLCRGIPARVIAPIERSHLLSSSRRGQLIMPSSYVLPLPPRARYVASPFVVAREVIRGRRVLSMNTLTRRLEVWNGLEVQVLRAMRRRPMGSDAVARRVRQANPTATPRAIRRAVERLADAGILVLAEGRGAVRSLEAEPQPLLEPASLESPREPVLDSTFVPLSKLRVAPGVA